MKKTSDVAADAMKRKVAETATSATPLPALDPLLGLTQGAAEEVSMAAEVPPVVAAPAATGKTPWEPIPGIDDPPDPTEKKPTSLAQFQETLRKAGYKVGPSGETFLRQQTAVPEDLSGVKFMVQIVVPYDWMRKYLKKRTTVQVWTKKKGWQSVAWFKNPVWAKSFAHDLAEDLQNQLEGDREAFG